MKQKILFAVLLLNAIFSIAVLCLYGCLEDKQLEVMASIAGDRCRQGGGKYGNGGCVPVLRTADGFVFEAVGILIPRCPSESFRAKITVFTHDTGTVETVKIRSLECLP